MGFSTARTELWAFWYWSEKKPSQSIDMSKASVHSAVQPFAAEKRLMSGLSMSSTTLVARAEPKPQQKIIPSWRSTRGSTPSCPPRRADESAAK